MAEQTVAEAKSVMQVGKSYTGFGRKALLLLLPLLPLLLLLPAHALPLPERRLEGSQSPAPAPAVCARGGAAGGCSACAGAEGGADAPRGHPGLW